MFCIVFGEWDFVILFILVSNAAGRRNHPYGPLFRAFYWAVALGQNSRGRVSKEARGVCEAKGVCEV